MEQAIATVASNKIATPARPRRLTHIFRVTPGLTKLNAERVFGVIREAYDSTGKLVVHSPKAFSVTFTSPRAAPYMTIEVDSVVIELIDRKTLASTFSQLDLSAAEAELAFIEELSLL